MEETRTKLQKITLIAVAAMLVGFGILMAVSHLLFRGVAFEETLLRVEESAGETVYTGKVRGERVRIAVSSAGENTKQVICEKGDGSRDAYTMAYPLPPIQTERGQMVDGVRIRKNDQMLFEGGYDPADTLSGWYLPDGTWDIDVVFVTGEAPAVRELTRGQVAYLASGPELAARGSWALYLLMALFSVLVALDAAFPMTIFTMQHCCDVRDPEPSDFYLSMQRVSWVVYPFLLFAGYTAALLQLP
ncbi:hypothetical protein [Oscillibacter sp.]|uniref:hypothetical protein n=1 Tax=Oscillibacter sp. TaxID=1945593 RepID=UPI002606AEB3|nr:hypothetical protein [Oscillibacter sp.]MDD3347459.1 hypothetical protein [Oscillibacter sp.]